MEMRNVTYHPYKGDEECYVLPVRIIPYLPCIGYLYCYYMYIPSKIAFQIEKHKLTKRLASTQNTYFHLLLFFLFFKFFKEKHKF